MSIYVGCALTQAPDTFKRFATDFNHTLIARTGVRIIEFVGLTNGTPADVYSTDLGNVTASDAMIALVDQPSLGLGMEIQLAIMLGKPLLCLHHKDARVTRMITGAHDLEVLQLATYADLDEALIITQSFLLMNAPMRVQA